MSGLDSVDSVDSVDSMDSMDSGDSVDSPFKCVDRSVAECQDYQG